MTFTYARVGLELWGSQSIGECTQRQLDNIKSKRRVSTYFRDFFLVNKFRIFCSASATHKRNVLIKMFIDFLILYTHHAPYSSVCLLHTYWSIRDTKSVFIIFDLQRVKRVRARARKNRWTTQCKY